VLCVTLAAAWAAAPSFACAEPQLAWSAPAACPDEAAVRGAMEGALDPAEAPRATLSVDAEVRAGRDGFELLLAVQTPSGTSRERLVASDCALFVRLIALKVALLSTAADAAVSGAGVAAPKPPASLGAQLSPWSLRAQALAGSAPLPAAGLGVTGGVGYRADWLQLVGLASYLFPRELYFAEQPGVGGAFQGWVIGARACGVSPWPLALAACAGVEAGLVRGQGLSVTPANVTDRPFASATAGVSATAALGRLVGLRLDVEALLGVVRPAFFVRNLGQLDRAPALGARALLGVEVRLP
jgi:hypothetical protein